MNAADNGIIAAKKIIINFTAKNCRPMALTTGLFVFGKIGAQEQHVLRTASFIRDLSLEMSADEKVCSGLMLAGGNSRKLESFCEKPLLPPPENREISFLTVYAIS